MTLSTVLPCVLSHYHRETTSPACTDGGYGHLFTSFEYNLILQGPKDVQFILKITTQLTLQQQFNDNILLAVKSRKILSDYKWIQTSNLYLSTRYMSSHAETNEAMAATTLL
uniref:Uncharacterized protein n=1 Tax=Oryza nivara TaxID=4536 RepID=A0A0E0FW45_ORYNI